MATALATAMQIPPVCAYSPDTPGRSSSGPGMRTQCSDRIMNLEACLKAGHHPRQGLPHPSCTGQYWSFINTFMPLLDLLPCRWQPRSGGQLCESQMSLFLLLFRSHRLNVLLARSFAVINHSSYLKDMFLTKKPTAAFSSPQDGNMIKPCLSDSSILFSTSTLEPFSTRTSPSPRWLSVHHYHSYHHHWSLTVART